MCEVREGLEASSLEIGVDTQGTIIMCEVREGLEASCLEIGVDIHQLS